MNESISGKRFGWVLTLLISYLFLSPFIPADSNAALGVHFLLSLTLFFTARAVQKGHPERSIALVVMGLALLLYWLGIFQLVPFSAESALLLFVVFYALLIYALTRQLLQADEVTKGVIAAALSLYLIIGLLWGACYALLNEMHGKAFSGTLIEQADTSHLHIFNYFSMVTLTTLGYGDITPQIPEAASLCQLEAIVGQFFTAVLVAWLVGTYRKPAPDTPQD